MQSLCASIRAVQFSSPFSMMLDIWREKKKHAFINSFVAKIIRLNRLRAVSYHSSLTFLVSGQAQQGFSGFFCSVGSEAAGVATPAAHTVDMFSDWVLNRWQQYLINILPLDVGKDKLFFIISSNDYGRLKPSGVKDVLSKPKTAFSFSGYIRLDAGVYLQQSRLVSI